MRGSRDCRNSECGSILDTDRTAIVETSDAFDSLPSLLRLLIGTLGWICAGRPSTVHVTSSKNHYRCGRPVEFRYVTDGPEKNRSLEQQTPDTLRGGHTRRRIEMLGWFCAAFDGP